MRHLAALLSIALCACGTSAAGYDGTNDSKADELAPEDAPVLAASYGFVATSTMVACSTRAGANECEDDERKTVTATIRGLATTTQEGAAVETSFNACRINLEWDGESYKDSEYFNDTDTLRNLGELAHMSGSFVQSEGGPVLVSGLSALLLGAELASPVEEDMPTSDNDARALDQDQDGKAGVSLDAPLGRVFLGARVIFELPLSLSAGDDGSLSGALDVGGFDFSVYDDSIPFVNAKKKANEALEKVKMVSQDHQVTLIPDYTDCDRVLAEL